MRQQGHMANMVRTKSFGYDPPADLSTRKLPILEFQGKMLRIFRQEFTKSGPQAGILHFGRSMTERFDDPKGKYGVCYLGADDYACFIETFGRARRKEIDRVLLSERGIAEVSASTVLKLVNITGRGLAHVGAAGEVSAGDHILSQNWSRAFYEHSQEPDGIYYCARHDLSKYCIALFARAKGKVRVASYMNFLDTQYQARLGQILDHYQFALLPDA